jgi:phosphomannomutase
VAADPDWRARARAWSAVDPDPETREQLARMLDADDESVLAELFDGRLGFGTAGLRAPMGPGPRRMNRVVVQRATAGLMANLPAGAGVVIGHDARKNSATFALDVARTVAGLGGRALMLPAHAPTPLVAFAVRHLGADAGVMCTASHNPASDNGYKVYLADGAQVLAPVDERIAAAIDADEPVPLADPHSERIEPLGPSAADAYVDHVGALVPEGHRDVEVVYSPLHGVGADITRACFARAGFAPPVLVDAQADPDPVFPTIGSPNPEAADALALTLEQARAVDADVALVHDPDADRLGVLVPGADGWRALTGNEIGLLLADHVLSNTEGDDRLVVDTVVSSSALAALASFHRVHHVRTLTGFKWIVRPGIEHPEWRFVFGYEEALGYSVDPYVRDKDGISAALYFAELVATSKAAGTSVDHRLRDLAVEHGLFATGSFSLVADDGRALVEVTRELRRNMPSHIGSHRVTDVDDLLPDGGTDLVVMRLDPSARVCIRPSGTEPKLKVYTEVVEQVPDTDAYDEVGRAATAHLDALRIALRPVLEAMMNG